MSAALMVKPAWLGIITRGSACASMAASARTSAAPAKLGGEVRGTWKPQEGAGRSAPRVVRTWPRLHLYVGLSTPFGRRRICNAPPWSWCAGEKLRDPKLEPVHQRATEAMVRAGAVGRDAEKRRRGESIRRRSQRDRLVAW